MQANYLGTPAHVYPPIQEEGWEDVAFESNELARTRAQEIGRATITGELGALDVWQYRDEVLANGLHRFFRFATPIGTAVGAIRYAGEEAADTSTLGLGAPFVPGTDSPNGNTVVDEATAIAVCSGGFKALVDGVDSWPGSMTQDAVAFAQDGSSNVAYVFTEDTPGPGLYKISTSGTLSRCTGTTPANWKPGIVPNPTPTPGTTSTSSSTTTYVMIGGVLIALGVAAYAALGR